MNIENLGKISYQLQVESLINKGEVFCLKYFTHDNFKDALKALKRERNRKYYKHHNIKLIEIRETVLDF